MARNLIKENNQDNLILHLESGYLQKPYVALVSGATAPDFNSLSPTSPNQKYFSIMAVGKPGLINFPTGVTWSVDSGSTWSSASTLTISDGQEVWVKGDHPTFNAQNKFNFSLSKFVVYGNIMSLLFEDSFEYAYYFNYGESFESLFENCTELIEAQNLVLPAPMLEEYVYKNMFKNSSIEHTPTFASEYTNLTYGCFYHMFHGCTKLKNINLSIVANIVSDYCFEGMFYGCTSLVNSPIITINEPYITTDTFKEMFKGCTSLTISPELPYEYISNGSYSGMFDGCSSLSYIKCLTTDISASNCTENWVNGVSQTGTFVKNSSMNSWTTGVNGIPSGWTVENAS